MTLDARVLDEAADWLMRLHDSAATPADRAACEQWQRAHPDHARAWSRAEQLMGKFGSLPAALAMPVLGRTHPARARGRRAAVAKLAALLAVAPAGWLGWRLADTRGWTADLHTATGERRALTLPDGSQLLLDTASAVDLRFDSALRRLHLRHGTIAIQTAADRSGMSRPFVVDTALGRFRALGTRFTLRAQADSVHLAVSEGAVEITPHAVAQPALVVAAGQQSLLSRDGAAAPQPAQPETWAWIHGMLMADAMPLASVCAELARYRPGLLYCSAEVAQLRVSGAFPLGDTDQALSMLASTYPVEVRTRLRGHWVSVVAR